MRERLLEDVAFEEQPVPFIIKLGDKGDYHGIEERRGEIMTPSRKKEESLGEHRTRAKHYPRRERMGTRRTPALLASSGYAATRPADQRRGEESWSRETFWKQIRQAAETNDAAIEAVLAFGGQVIEDTSLATRIRAHVEQLKPGASDRCTFAVHSDLGKTIVERPGIREWYRRFFEGVTGKRKQAGPTGLCQITATVGPIPTSSLDKTERRARWLVNRGQHRLLRQSSFRELRTGRHR